MPTNAMLLKEEKSGHEKGNLKGCLLYTSNAIAAIVPTAMSRKLTPNVLINVCVNRRSLNASVKFLNPTQVLSQIGSANVAGFTS